LSAFHSEKRLACFNATVVFRQVTNLYSYGDVDVVVSVANDALRTVIESKLAEFPLVRAASTEVRATSSQRLKLQVESIQEDGSISYKLTLGSLKGLVYKTLLDLVDVIGCHLFLEIAHRSSKFLFVHSAVIQIEGHCILLPGLSMSGKSTLAHALICEGGVYLSDEFAVIDSEGLVHAFLQPLSLRHPFPRKVSLEELGFTTDPLPAPIGFVYFLEFQEQNTIRLESVSRGNAALGMFGNTLTAQAHGHRDLFQIAQALTQAQCFRGVRGCAKEAAREIRRIARNACSIT
jgi:hypothetical protein